MSDTTNLTLPMLEAAQAQKHVTVNAALQNLDLVVQLSVIDRTRTAPPPSPADGTRYLVAASATDDWAGHDHQIAARQDGAWTYLLPNDGWQAHVAAEGRTITYADGKWRDAFVWEAFGAGTVFDVLSEEHTLSAAATSDTTFVIPERSILLGVTCLVSETVTGATSFSVGIAGDDQRFGSAIGLAVNTHLNAGVTPVAYDADTAIRFTAAGADFTGGKIRVAGHVVRLQIPDLI